MFAELFMHCPVCATVCLVETPPCADGHGELCPERACAQCGTALFVDPLTDAATVATIGAAGRTRRTGRTGRSRRRAA